tara:strand:+ start:299 stop:634 length:336 start_codon:yes stop_codon:yes gene_type:complete
MIKFKLGNSENWIWVSVIYKVKQELEEEEIFICTPELLDKYKLPVDKFVLFLQESLDFDDPYYSACYELWAANRGINSKTRVIDNSNFKISRVSQITSKETGEINLDHKRK